MDNFFKLVNSTKSPTCAEANEYLAEDRVMCLQIYIKKSAGYFLTYIPNAKARTDAPETLLVFMKQRRRWMNGALFAAWRVLFNAGRMIGITGKSTHPIYRQIGMAIFMVYYFLNQFLQLIIVGQYFITIKMFFSNAFKGSIGSVQPSCLQVSFLQLRQVLHVGDVHAGLLQSRHKVRRSFLNLFFHIMLLYSILVFFFAQRSHVQELLVSSQLWQIIF